jgi:lantibiotic transport system ATP-binding protein
MAKQRQTSFVTFETSDNGQTLAVIEEMGLAPRIESNKVALPIVDREQIAEINRRLIHNGVGVYRIATIENDLEAIFFDVIGE